MIAPDGKYTCGPDGGKERLLYDDILTWAQESVDSAKEAKPEWSEQRLHEYLENSEPGTYLSQIKDCLVGTHGYDPSSLGFVTVPELPAGAGYAITAGLMAGSLGLLKLKNYLTERKEKKNSAYKK